jgi:hypothetical protein
VLPDFPKRLAITVVADESALGTFQQRVSSWFTDGTEVELTVTSGVDREQLLASSPTEVRACLVLLSAERALLIFSYVSAQTAPRYLLRELPLPSGFDELGLERLASVIHSAFAALSEGVDSLAREQAERELGQAGVSVGALVVPSEQVAPVPLAPATPLGPVVALPRRERQTATRPATSAGEQALSLLIGVGYGARLRGPEGLGQGPTLALGAQLRGARAAFDLLLTGQLLLASTFEARPFDASVQTTALRFQFGIEPRLRASLFGQALLGLGADVARVSASAATSSADELRLLPHTNGTQWRSAGELTLGIVWHGELLDVSAYAQAIFAFEDVRYNAVTSEGELPLVRPWPVQPALGIQGRFRSAL